VEEEEEEAGLVSDAEHVGVKFSQELINAPSDIKTHLGGLDDRESLLFLNTDE